MTKENDFKTIFRFKKDLDNLAELSWHEKKTKNYIINELGKDYYWSKKTAVVYKIGNGPAVFFRSELDALNTVFGPRHVCGHSTHTAALMAAYFHLKKNPSKNYAIYFIFQPSEENYPSGAEFISKSLPELRKCKAGFAFHVAPEFPLGSLINPVFASGDYFEIKIKGRSAHVKDKNIFNKPDAILVGSELAHKINSKKMPHWIANVGIMRGGESSNKIAGGAFLAGDVRAFTEKNRVEVRKWLKELCMKARKRYKGIQINLHYFRGYPVLKNDSDLLKRVGGVLPVKMDTKSFGTEDFSLYPVPKIFLLVGTNSKEKLHSDNFKVDKRIAKNIFLKFIRIAENLNKIIQ